MKKIMLFCLPYAGGTAYAYLAWKKYFNDSIVINPVELAGRGSRFNDNMYNSFNDAVEDAYKSISRASLGNAQYALYGHSMGSWLVYEICHKIMNSNLSKPLHIFLSGRYVPDKQKKGKKTYLLDDELFIEEILKLGGTSEEVFKNESLRKVFLPVLRSDYRIIDEYVHYPKKSRLESDITYFFSKDDDITFEEANEWACLTSGIFNIKTFEGGHFFINEYTRDVVQAINDTLFAIRSLY